MSFSCSHKHLFRNSNLRSWSFSFGSTLLLADVVCFPFPKLAGRYILMLQCKTHLRATKTFCAAKFHFSFGCDNLLTITLDKTLQIDIFTNADVCRNLQYNAVNRKIKEVNRRGRISYTFASAFNWFVDYQIGIQLFHPKFLLYFNYVYCAHEEK